MNVGSRDRKEIGIPSAPSAPSAPIAQLRARFAFPEAPIPPASIPTALSTRVAAEPETPAPVQPAAQDKAGGLADVADLINDIRRRQFGGKLPDALARVAGIYTELAGERLERGESVGGVIKAISLAAANALAIERGAEIGFTRNLELASSES